MYRRHGLCLIILSILFAAALGCEEGASTGAADPLQGQNASTSGIQNASPGTSGSGPVATTPANGAGGSQTVPVSPDDAGNTGGAVTYGTEAGQGGAIVAPVTGGTIGNAVTGVSGGTGGAGTGNGQSGSGGQSGSSGQNGSGGETPDATIAPIQDAGGNADTAVAECLGAYQFTVESVDVGEQSLCDYKGDVLLIVNIAANCGFTSQLGGLAELQTSYNNQGFNVLGFWNNQFLNQMGDPIRRSEVVAQYGVDFPLFAETNVNPPDEHPLFTWLKAESGGGNVGWNFEKFLVARDGSFVNRYPTATTPAQIAADIESAL